MMSRTLLLLCAVCGVIPLPVATQHSVSLPSSALAVRTAGGWHTFWRSSAAPSLWIGAAGTVENAVAWRGAGPGVEWGELYLAGSGEAFRIRALAVRIDPRLVRLRLTATPMAWERPTWTVDSAARESVVALNVGQFRDNAPWGWIIRDGRELQPPGAGPLSMALVADSSGVVRLVAADGISQARAHGGIAQAFQSYPALLVGNGSVPNALMRQGNGIDVAHRDSRLAIGELPDGRLLIVLTRFEGAGGYLSQLPFGFTTPEMAALMGALGCQRAVLLDGGISGQLALRDGAGELRAWRGLRKVPVGMIAIPRCGDCAGWR